MERARSKEAFDYGNELAFGRLPAGGSGRSATKKASREQHGEAFKAELEKGLEERDKMRRERATKASVRYAYGGMVPQMRDYSGGKRVKTGKHVDYSTC